MIRPSDVANSATTMAADWPRQARPRQVDRDPLLRRAYLDAALAAVPRLLGAVDRNPYRATYGCFDREFWHYRTSAFASEMYQEAVYPLALVYRRRLPGNRWYGEPRLRELAIAGMRFAARSCHTDASCDDYYPYERALGAAVFSLAACASAYRELNLDDHELSDWLVRRSRWVAEHDESGRLANHHALAVWGLAQVAEITGDDDLAAAAQQCTRQVLRWQSPEGWFEEYGGADPGYQTVTIDALAKYRRMTGAAWLDEPLERAVRFARHFLHPDDSYGGEYGSRGTYHFYPHGFELLAGDNAAAVDLADGFLVALSTGRAAMPADDRLLTHPLASMIEAYCDWSPRRTLNARQQGDGLNITTFARRRYRHRSGRRRTDRRLAGARWCDQTLCRRRRAAHRCWIGSRTHRRSSMRIATTRPWPSVVVAEDA